MVLPSDDWLFRWSDSLLECQPDERKCKNCNNKECEFYNLRFGDKKDEKNI